VRTALWIAVGILAVLAFEFAMSRLDWSPF
jgi:hypothetical protein